MKNLLAIAFLMTLVSCAGVPNAQGCSAGLGKRAVKLGGTMAGMPAECAINTCRALTMMTKETHTVPDPLCNPVLGPCDPIVVLDFKYQLKSGTLPTNGCPTTINNGPWYPASQDTSP